MTDTLSISLEQTTDYQFVVNFGKDSLPALITDEDAPVGHGTGPDPTRLLGTAVANCLVASLLFSLRKFKNLPEPIRADAKVHMTRNEQGRLRIGSIDVQLGVNVPAEDIAQLERILAQFEDFCVVTQSVRKGLQVNVSVKDGNGKVLYGEG
ncbi:OsmC family protein [Chitinimonas sp. PSY-7]|uniref:OsmC family protein n=1 Tax=Chitinimonas sp. PSY-7 TaxID=3459088 RepID=UPI00403FFC4C